MPLFNPEWLNENENRNYPFKTGVNLQSGDIKIPTSFLVDAVFAGTNQALRYRVNYIQVDDGFVQIGIADDNGVFHGVVNVQTDLPNEKYILGFFQPQPTSTLRGKVIFGPGLQTIAKLPFDRYFLGFEQAELEPSTCVPAAAPVVGVKTIRELGATRPEKILTGDVQIQAGRGVVVDFDNSTNSITISVEKQWDCNCPEDFNRIHPCRGAIKTINGVKPAANGDIRLLNGKWIYVTNKPSENAIEVGFVGDVDCCCDACADLEALRTQLANILGAV